MPFYHIDLYRLTPEQVPDLGLHEYLDSDGISVIEWAERAEGELPDEVIRVSLECKEEESREIEIRGMEV
jgi:tRNA threonylcarbamoyladenosine biosynthesis protein TsaE